MSDMLERCMTTKLSIDFTGYANALTSFDGTRLGRRGSPAAGRHQ